MKQRVDKVINEQKEILVDFMLNHLDFARNKLLGAEGKIISHNLWLVLSEQLNATGPEKSVTKWQRVWVDLKMNVKKKASATRGSRRRIGERPEENVRLTDVEEKVLQIISNTAINGNPNPNEVTLDIEEKSQAIEEPKDIQDPQTEKKVEPSTSRLIHITKTEEKEPSDNMDMLNPSIEMRGSDAESEDIIPRKKYKNTKTSAETTDFRDLSYSIICAIENMNKTLNTFTNQMEEIIEERRNTNILLLRIVQALEKNNVQNK